MIKYSRYSLIDTGNKAIRFFFESCSLLSIGTILFTVIPISVHLSHGAERDCPRASGIVRSGVRDARGRLKSMLSAGYQLITLIFGMRHVAGAAIHRTLVSRSCLFAEHVQRSRHPAAVFGRPFLPVAAPLQRSIVDLCRESQEKFWSNKIPSRNARTGILSRVRSVEIEFGKSF